MSSATKPINVFADALERVRMAARTVLPNANVDRVEVEPPRDASHGDIATNAAMVLARPARRNPIELANEIAEHLKSDATISDARVAPPGFINLTINRGVWEQEL